MMTRMEIANVVEWLHVLHLLLFATWREWSGFPPPLSEFTV